MATSGLVDVADLETANGEKDLARAYMPTTYTTFAEVVTRLEGDAMRGGFLDFGCGKGRALILAGIFGFRKISGVEFDSRLCETARNNIETFKSDLRGAADISIYNQDARDFDIPDDTTVFYFFNPFSEAVMDPVLRNIRESLLRTPRTHALVYVHPLCHEIFAGSGFELLESDESRVGQKYNLYALRQA